ncbi:jg20978 [Pararge aegeria aegeria]|uniref:Jg20978 protein n=1 Tax=Pararge aegeria aegeria TaxID=348720 RepID=A0A8S4RD17_9NEOP|nr:jg20978 [Pararge aegeria aegeria]
MDFRKVTPASIQYLWCHVRGEPRQRGLASERVAATRELQRVVYPWLVCARRSSRSTPSARFVEFTNPHWASVADYNPFSLWEEARAA